MSPSKAICAQLERKDILLIALMMAYCFVGLTGFDPSRQDEAYIFGITLEFLRGDHWLVPMLAGEPFMEKPPLYYLVAACSARLFSGLLPLHDGARIASGFFTALTAGAVAASGRLLWGAGYGRFAALALLSTLGLLIPAHMLLTDNAVLAGTALALLGLAAMAQHKPWAGWILGAGGGVAFLAKGLFGIGVIVLAILLLLCGAKEWRTRNNMRVLGVAFIASLPWLLVWPLLLLKASQPLFMEWLWINNLGRFFGFSVAQLGAVHQGDFWYKVLPWATFPLLPLVVPALRQMGSRRWRQPAVQLALAFSSAVLLVMSSASSIRAIYALPLLPALALVVAPLLRAPPRWVDLSMAAAAILVFNGIVIGSWLLWLILALGHTPPLPSVFGAALTADLKMPIDVLNVALAAAVTVVWFICGYVWRRAAWRGPAQWFASLFALLAIVAWLWVPWVTQAKSSYRALYLRMAAYLPTDGCIASKGLGESQRGMLDYVLNIKTQRQELTHTIECRSLLVDTSIRELPPRLPAGWRLVWRGQRASDDHEVFLLYVRTDGETEMARASNIDAETPHSDITKNTL